MNGDIEVHYNILYCLHVCMNINGKYSIGQFVKQNISNYVNLTTIWRKR